MGNRLTFKGGVHPLPKLRYGKYLTDHCAIETMPPVAKVRIPCAQHAGAPAVPIVETGQKVKLGEKIAEANGFVSVPVHASVSGTVTAITKSYNKIAQDVYKRQR